MEQTYVYCNSHCKHPAYTKEQVDALVKEKTDEVLAKTNFVTINETLVISDGTSNTSVELDFPEGFTRSNCVVVSQMISYKEANIEKGIAWHTYPGLTLAYGVSVDLGGEDNVTYQDIGEKIRINVNKLSGTVSGDFPIDVKITLMKVGA